ncbi:MAG: hydrogenase iron-sulfur subunit [Candidatus Lokiarchaeota archaeon]|nr:hydrogenase iron-sulfur subunit [Candidatus Lokiarchaeota archaeon]
MDLYSILSHPFRRKILFLLEREGYLLYSEIMDRLGLDLTGQLNFHLKKLGSLISKERKSYFLTEDGKRILNILNLNERILAGDEIEHLISKGSNLNRIGIIVCNCNEEISNIINVNNLTNELNNLENVVSVRIFENLCQEINLEKVTNWVKENFLNKIVVAACSPKSHKHSIENMFEDVIEYINIEFANIREQCCWAHSNHESQLNPLIIAHKAYLLIEAAVERVILQGAIKIKRIEVEKSCAIFGGGIAGMTLALNLAHAGIKVYLIEKSPTLGGKVARWHRISNMGDCSICFISDLIGEIVKREEIEIHTNIEINKISGELGNFNIELIKKPRFVDEKRCTGCLQCIEVCGNETYNEYEFGLTKRKIIHFPFSNCYPYAPLIVDHDIAKCKECRICERVCLNKAINLEQKTENFQIRVGAKVMAIGADLFFNLHDYGYDPTKNIITSAEFERMLSSDGLTGGKLVRLSDNQPINSISIIQEIGPSDYVCEYSDDLALKYIEDITIRNPKCEVNIFYDLSKLRDNQDILLRYTHPKFLYANNVSVKIGNGVNYVIADYIEFPSDLIVLNHKVVPNKDLVNLRKTLDFTFDEDGFMSKETLASGVYGVGSILGPMNYRSTISSANTIALKIISLLSNDYLIADFTGINLNEEKCGLCGLCIKSCPFNAITLDSEKIKIDGFKCKGCGSCVSSCPTGALEMNIDSTEKILRTIEVFSKSKIRPKILIFACESCGYAAADDAGLKKLVYPPNVFIIKVACAGRVDSEFILYSLKCGFDGIMVVGCRENSCNYIDGITQAKSRIDLLRENFEPEIRKRIILLNLNSIEGKKFSDSVNRFHKLLSIEVRKH